MSPSGPPWTSTATELVALLRSGELSATELTQSLLNRIEEVEGDVRAFITLTPEEKKAWKKALVKVHQEAESRVGKELIQSIYKETGFDPNKL